MMGELLDMARLLGPSRMLANARKMRAARDDIRGYVTTTVSWALMRAGFFDALRDQGRVDLAEFARREALDPTILRECCRYLARLGHLRETDGRVSFTPAGEKRWAQVNGVVSIFSAYEPFFANLGDFLTKRSEPGSQRRDDDRVAAGFRETGASFTFAAMARIIEAEGFSGMVELGCGNIDLSLYVCRRDPSMRALGVDRDRRYLDEARGTIEAEGLGDRVSLLEHDLFTLTPDSGDFSGYDAVAAIDLLHGYFYEGRDRLLELLRALRGAFPSQRLLISDMCLADEPKMRSIKYPMVEHELFHALTGQRTFAAGELESMLEEAGFRITRRWAVRNLAARLFLLLE
jgi:hypothetical protein